jgi:hypothetical protein
MKSWIIILPERLTQPILKLADNAGLVPRSTEKVFKTDIKIIFIENKTAFLTFVFISGHNIPLKFKKT